MRGAQKRDGILAAVREKGASPPLLPSLGSKGRGTAIHEATEKRDGNS